MPSWSAACATSAASSPTSPTVADDDQGSAYFSAQATRRREPRVRTTSTLSPSPAARYAPNSAPASAARTPKSAAESGAGGGCLGGVHHPHWRARRGHEAQPRAPSATLPRHHARRPLRRRLGGRRPTRHPQDLGPLLAAAHADGDAGRAGHHAGGPVRSTRAARDAADLGSAMRAFADRCDARSGRGSAAAPSVDGDRRSGGADGERRSVAPAVAERRWRRRLAVAVVAVAATDRRVATAAQGNAGARPRRRGAGAAGRFDSGVRRRGLRAHAAVAVSLTAEFQADHGGERATSTRCGWRASRWPTRIRVRGNEARQKQRWAGLRHEDDFGCIWFEETVYGVCNKITGSHPLVATSRSNAPQWVHEGKKLTRHARRRAVRVVLRAAQPLLRGHRRQPRSPPTRSDLPAHRRHAAGLPRATSPRSAPPASPSTRATTRSSSAAPSGSSSGSSPRSRGWCSTSSRTPASTRRRTSWRRSRPTSPAATAPRRRTWRVPALPRRLQVPRRRRRSARSAAPAAPPSSAGAGRTPAPKRYLNSVHQVIMACFEICALNDRRNDRTQTPLDCYNCKGPHAFVDCTEKLNKANWAAVAANRPYVGKFAPADEQQFAELRKRVRASIANRSYKSAARTSRSRRPCHRGATPGQAEAWGEHYRLLAARGAGVTPRPHRQSLRHRQLPRSSSHPFQSVHSALASAQPAAPPHGGAPPHQTPAPPRRHQPAPLRRRSPAEPPQRGACHAQGRCRHGGADRARRITAHIAQSAASTAAAPWAARRARRHCSAHRRARARAAPSQTGARAHRSSQRHWRRQRQLPTNPPPLFAKGEQVVYARTATAIGLPAKVIGVHLEDPADPYYTVLLPDGSERNTTPLYLRKATLPTRARHGAARRLGHADAHFRPDRRISAPSGRRRLRRGAAPAPRGPPAALHADPRRHGG